MSWVKVVSYSGEDVFDENADDFSLLTKEWTSNMKKRVRDGYVDGVDAGEEATLQLGFNQGFREGAAKTVPVGRLKGIVSAVCCWCQIQHPEQPVPASVRDLLQQVSEYESLVMEGIRMALENPPPSVSSVSESMEDLDVKQTDASCCGKGSKETNCCRAGEKMDVDVPNQQKKPCAETINCSSSSGGSLSHLVQCCVDLVLELGLPQELISKIQELKTM